MQAIQKIINSNNCSADTRTLRKSEIFFDLGSKSNRDGNYFVKALKKKPLFIVTQNKKRNLSGKNFIIVKNIYSFYVKSISQKFKKKPKYKVAVTGTNGKTSVAFFYYKILNLLGIKVSSIGTLGVFENTQKSKGNLTTPDFFSNHKSLNHFYKKRINYSIIEASSHGLKQNRLENINFDCGIFTNLSHDHLDYHRTMKDYLNSKLILFKKLVKKRGFLVTGSEVSEFPLLNKISKYKNLNLLSYGRKGNVIKIISSKPDGQFTKLKINVLGKVRNLKLKLIGNFQIENFLAATLACYSCGISLEKIFKICSRIDNPPGRLQLLKKQNKTVIIDYAHTPDALEKTIIEIQKFFNKKINIVFGCGGDRDHQKRKAMGKIAYKLCNKIYITDDNPRFESAKKVRMQIKAGCPNAIVIPSRKMAIKNSILSLNEEILLIAGKGHEEFQLIKNKKIAFSDHYCVTRYLK
jgi:UDP-N-acetylmuramyl-tripeptide synthetase